MRLFAGLPSYDGRRWNGRALAAMQSSGLCAVTMEVTSSLLTFAFNQCWVAALNARAQGVTHFLLLHADVVPETPEWLTHLTLEMHLNPAIQILSVAVPIKSSSGRVSVALEKPEEPWNPHGLTADDLAARPVTWTEPGLLVNSGMLLVDIRQPWVEQVRFTVEDRLVCRDGVWYAEVFSEDWNFSRQAARLGVASWVTRRVAVTHMGVHGWSSPWL